MGGKEYPSSAFMVVEDSKSPDTWHLRVKDSNGNLVEEYRYDLKEKE